MLNGSHGNIVHGGQSEESSLYMAPTLITNVTPDDVLMEVCMWAAVGASLCAHSGTHPHINAGHTGQLCFNTYTEHNAT